MAMDKANAVLSTGYWKGLTIMEAQMKPHYQCTAKECRKELEALHQVRPNDDMTVAELRVMLKEYRIRMNLLHPKVKQNNEIMARIKVAGVKELRDLCTEHKIKGEKLSMGEMSTST